MDGVVRTFHNQVRIDSQFDFASHRVIEERSLEGHHQLNGVGANPQWIEASVVFNQHEDYMHPRLVLHPFIFERSVLFVCLVGNVNFWSKQRSVLLTEITHNLQVPEQEVALLQAKEEQERRAEM